MSPTTVSTPPFSRSVVTIGLVQGVLFAALWSWLLSGIQNRSIVEVLMPFGLVAGLSFGMAMSLVMAWLAQVISIRVPFENQVDFLFRMNEAAAGLGYEPGPRKEQGVIYHPRLRLRGSSPLVVQFDGRAAVIAGPQWQIVRLRHSLET
jgi:hypothetical protein